MMNLSLFQLDLSGSSSNFFVVKQEAPTEYHGLGNSLSTRRNKEVEIGQSHVTASKLGGLFDGVRDPRAWRESNALKPNGRS